MIPRAPLLALFLAAFLALFITPISSLTVCESGCDYTTISQAISNAPPNKVINVFSGTYSGGPLTVTTFNLTLFINDTVAIASGEPYAIMLTVQKRFTIAGGGYLILPGGISVENGAVFMQEASINVSCSDICDHLVHVSEGTWVQKGPTGLRRTTSGIATVGVEVGSTWDQASDCSINSFHHTPAVELGGVWNQAGAIFVKCNVDCQGVRVFPFAQWTSAGAVGLGLMGYTGVVVNENAVWRTTASSVVSVNAKDIVEGGAVVVLGTWVQRGSVVMNLKNSTGVYALTGATWTQFGDVSLNATSGPGYSSTGIRFGFTDVPTVRWNQFGALSLALQGADTKGVSCISSLQWYSTGSVNASTTDNAVDFVDCTRITSIVTNSTNQTITPGLKISNLTTSAISLIPKDSRGQEQDAAALGIRLGTIKNNGGSTRTATARDGQWSAATDDTYGADASYLYECTLDFSENGDSSLTGSLALQFYLFSTTRNISLGTIDEGDDNETEASYEALPSLAKIVVRLEDWQWLTDDPEERADISVSVTPKFSSFREVSSTEPFVREFELSGQEVDYAGSVTVRLRLALAVEADGRLLDARDSAVQNGRKPVTFTLDPDSSSILLSFARFNSTLVYDPDLGVLLSEDGSGGSSDNTGLIVGVAVAIPVAIIFVIVVIAAGVGYAYWRKKHYIGPSRADTVNFDNEDL